MMLVGSSLFVCGQGRIVTSELKPLQHYFFYGIACISTFYKNLEIVLMFDLRLNELMTLKTHSSRP